MAHVHEDSDYRSSKSNDSMPALASINPLPSLATISNYSSSSGDDTSPISRNLASVADVFTREMAPIPKGGATTKKGKQKRRSFPVGTTVIIVGNSRSREEHQGKNGSVLAASASGGWHKIMLDDGNTTNVQSTGIEEIQAGGPPVIVPSSVQPVPALVNLELLSDESLRKYVCLHKLSISEDSPRSHLLSAVRAHFGSSSIIETEVIREFSSFVESRRDGN